MVSEMSAPLSGPKPKAYREGYSPGAFVFQQVSEEGARLVAWTPDLSQLKSALLAVLHCFPVDLEVLFKTEAEGVGARNGWRRYHGTVDRPTLLELLEECQELIFSDGGSMLCVRRPDSGEYLALDEHGILFVYSTDPTYLRLHEELGFPKRTTELLFESGHWHIRPARH
jgi:hypothetical protein